MLILRLGLTPQYARDLIENVFALQVQIVDAEYRFDHSKLTVYYDTLYRYDLREFVKALQTAFKTRVWLEKVEI